MTNTLSETIKLEVRYRKVGELTPYEKNARKHSEKQIAQIAKSIEEFGFTQPILTDGSQGVIAGHGRLLAAKLLGMTEVPTIELSGLSDTQRRAYIIADNKIALNAEWDDALLGFELTELGKLGLDPGLMGFDPRELAALSGTGGDTGLTDPDEVPAAQPNPVAARGDLWALGRHWLLCGNATFADDVTKVLRGVTPHLMVTDPPYGVNYDPNWRNEAARNGATEGRARGVIGGRAIGKVNNDDRADWREAWTLFPGEVAYVWHGALHAALVAESLQATGFSVRAQIIWAKNNIVIGRGHYHWQHEPCWYAVRDKGTGHWAGDRKQTTLWQIDKPMKSETGHGTQKPVECMKRPIENNFSDGQAVYDPFVGSGTTIIAAEMTGRACYAIELDPIYVDVCIRRWQDFTGQKAVLDGDGRDFETVAAERLPKAA